MVAECTLLLHHVVVLYDAVGRVRLETTIGNCL